MFAGFTGTYSHNLDTKGRLTIPVKFRELLEAGAFLTRGLDNHLMLLTEAAFEQFSTRINALSITETSSRQLKRLFFSTAFRVEFDSAGRILVPKILRDMAKLENEVVITGVGGYVELWAPEIWQLEADILNDVEANSQRYAEHNLTLNL